VSYPFDLAAGTPADRPTVLVTCPAGASTDVLVRYPAGGVWWAGQGAARGWAPLDPPPGNEALDLPVGWATTSGAALADEGGTDGHVWVTTGGVDAPGWVDLGNPADIGLSRLAVAEVPGTPRPLRLVAMVNQYESLWLRLDPLDGGVGRPAGWEPVETPRGTYASEVGVLVAGQGGDVPVAQVVVLVRDVPTETGRLAVLARGEPGGWRWQEPVRLPGSLDVGGLVVGSVTGSRGLRGYAAVHAYDRAAEADAGIYLLQGSGRSWTWSLLGTPPEEGYGRQTGVVGVREQVTAEVMPAVVVVAETDPAARLLLVDLDGLWTPAGAPPAEATVGSVAPGLGDPATRPIAAVAGDGRGVWTVWDGPDGPAWTPLRPLPSTLADVAGGLGDWDDPASPEPGFHVFTVGDDGRVWARTWNAAAWSWTDHGPPSAQVAARSGVGAVAGPAPVNRSDVVVLGSDQGLWHLTRSGAAWSWVAHGSPGDEPVRATAPPVLVGAGTADQRLYLVVWGRDGQVWVRHETVAGWQWESRGAPPGTTVFGLVGAIAAPSAAGGAEGLAVFVITDDGAVWGSWGPGVAGTWTSLGRPAPGRAAVAGLGVTRVATPAGLPLVRVLVLDGRDRRVRTATWPPGQPWLDDSPPPGVGITGSYGAVTDPDDGTRAVLFVPGTDRHLWALRRSEVEATWEDRGTLPGTGPVRGRAVLAGMVDRFPSWRVYAVAPVCADGGLVVGSPG
jgi:hypothetical protein